MNSVQRLRLLLQSLLLVLSSFLFSFFLSYRFLLGASHAQSYHLRENSQNSELNLCTEKPEGTERLKEVDSSCARSAHNPNVSS
jgi:hypothetical protein